MPRSHLARRLWVAAGSLSLALGAAGVVLPVLPTTPFVLLSAFCYARGSERLHEWLVTHPRFGPSLEAWSRHRAISPSAKRMSLAGMGLVLLVSLTAGVSLKIVALQAVVMGAAAAFILTRPAPPG